MGPMLLDVFGVRSPGAWFARGQKLGLCLCPIVFLHGEATIFNIFSTTMPFASYQGQNIVATFYGCHMCLPASPGRDLLFPLFLSMA